MKKSLGIEDGREVLSAEEIGLVVEDGEEMNLGMKKWYIQTEICFFVVYNNVPIQ